jgi:putative phosphoesterase
MFKIGVISDTHDFLDPRVRELFQGVDHILHGGDIGMAWLILDLKAIAPVTAVLGNTDEANLRFKQTEVIDLAGRKFLIHHIVNPRGPDEALRKRISRERPAVVVFGHTHKPFSETIQDILFFNPGYAGKARFGMERSVAILHCDEREIRPQYFVLD